MRRLCRIFTISIKRQFNTSITIRHINTLLGHSSEKVGEMFCQVSEKSKIESLAGVPMPVIPNSGYACRFGGTSREVLFRFMQAYLKSQKGSGQNTDKCKIYALSKYRPRHLCKIQRSFSRQSICSKNFWGTRCIVKFRWGIYLVTKRMIITESDRLTNL